MSDVPAEREHSDGDEVEASRAPLLSHLMELRTRLIVVMIGLGVGFAICFAFSYQLYNALTVPFIDAVEKAQNGAPAILNYAPLELFFARVKVAFFAGLMLSFPLVAHQLYAFVAPGLYKRERRAVLPYLAAIPVFFAMAILLVHQVVLPIVMDFALSMERPAEAAGGGRATYNLFVKVNEYLSLALTIIFAFGFAFQLPVVLSLLGQAGIVTHEGLAKARKYALLLAFVAAAVFTPPDPLSQIMLGLTIYGLYEISIVSVRFLARRADREQDENA